MTLESHGTSSVSSDSDSVSLLFSTLNHWTPISKALIDLNFNTFSSVVKAWVVLAHKYEDVVKEEYDCAGMFQVVTENTAKVSKDIIRIVFDGK